MPYKDLEVRKIKHKEYAAKHYQKNKDTVRATSKKSKQTLKQSWLEFKAQLSCTHCGFAHPAVMDFHHIGPKKYAVNALIKKSQYKLAYEEVKQCIPLCANCHRIHHHEERELKKGPKPLVVVDTD